MRNKVFSFALGTLACVFLALPAAAQSDSGGGLEGMFQGLYQAIAYWFGLVGDETNVGGYTMPGGLTVAIDGSPEMSPISFPGGFQAPGDSADLAPLIPPGGLSANESSPEVTPIIIPGG